jgi:ATP-binding cassette subfamily B protein
MSADTRKILRWRLKASAEQPRKGQHGDVHVREGGFAQLSSLDKPRRLYRAVQFALPQRHVIAMIVALTLIMAVLNAVEPLILKSVFDELAARDARVLALSIVALGSLALLREGLDGTSNWLTWRARIGLQYALLEATIGKLHKMPLRLQRSEGIGAIMTRLDRSIQGFTSAVSLILFNVLPSVIFLGIAAFVMFRLDWRLALLVLAFTPMPALIAMHAAPAQTGRERVLLDRWAHIYSRFNEVLSGIMVVRSFAMEDAEKSRFLQDVSAANQVVIRGVATDTGYGAASNLSIALARLSAIICGTYLAWKGQITVGTVIAFLGYVGGLFGPVQGLSGIYSSLRKAAVSLDEIFGILNVQEHLGDSPGATDLADVRGHVRFEHVQFRYEQAARPLLRGISLDVGAGQSLAVVGPSGSGKTTLMALLMRFYDPESGRITIDGRDLRSVRQSSLRRNIGVVLQDPLLFNDTIRANIAYGRPEATEAEIVAAARDGHALGFIERLPDRYETIVGERGSILSVGERQRITIARALLKNPAILVLDEATSALDAESEEAMQRALDHLKRRRTTFIAHRLATVVHADRIIVLKDGLIVENGTHGQLLRAGGYYASLVRRQSHGLIENDVDPSARVDVTADRDYSTSVPRETG